MTSLKSIMERRSFQVIDFEAMKNLKGGRRGGQGCVPPQEVDEGHNDVD